jgi:hypothetical protein
MFGPALSLLRPDGNITSAAACSSMPVAARTLGWYAQAAYGLLMPVAGFCTLEWRLKARWVRNTFGKQLVYGPFGWPRSQLEPKTLSTMVQMVISWSMVVAVALGLLWVGVTWVVPPLPLMTCQTCAEKGTCQPIQCGESC